MALTPQSDQLTSASPGPTTLQLAGTRTRQGLDPYADWYLSETQERWSDPAKNAYDAAIVTLQKELTLDENEAIWLRNQNSMQDVRTALSNAMKEYQTRSMDSKVRSWLASCSSRVMYYGAIFDTFAQHHPEYVSLAWGSMKFLFIAVLNHEELLAEFSKAVAKIADVLPRTELHYSLYPTNRMQEAVSLVYAKIIEFSVVAIKWYKKGKLSHSISAITKPFSLKYKPILEEIQERSRRVDELANAASKAEIRDLHTDVRELSNRLIQVTEMMAAYQQQQVLHNQFLFAFHQDYKQTFRAEQIKEIQDTILLRDAPLSDETLAYCRSMRNRRRQKLPIQTPISALSKLKTWVSQPSSSLLLAQGQGVRTSSADFAADFLDVILERRDPVIWALPAILEENKAYPSMLSILRSLVSQSLNLEPAIVTENMNPITIKHLKSTVNIHQWLEVFERCISYFPRLFLVLDLRSFQIPTKDDDLEHEYLKVSEFIESISEMVSRRTHGGLKVVIISWRFYTTTSLDATEIFGDLQIYTDMGKKAKRMMRQPKFRITSRKRNQTLVERLQDSLREADAHDGT
ncbi:hypothetical protein F5Y19DRAFT_427756 [Xylariaceae sp. FL1651]|nr:hypothetical protein F5Y19DRAFT_427756 [Xylariaceae sp. FL1651]